MYEIIGAIIGPLVTAVLAGIAVLGRQWQANKRSEADLEQLATEAAFLESWVAARERLRPLTEHEQQMLTAALERLDTQYSSVRLDQAKLRRKERTPAGVRVLRGFLQLDVVGGGAKTARVFYWIALLFGFMGSALFIAVSTEPSDSGVFATVFAAAFLSLMCFVPAGVMALVTYLLSTNARTTQERQAALQAARNARQEPYGYSLGYLPPTMPGYSPSGPQSASAPPDPQQVRRG